MKKTLTIIILCIVFVLIYLLQINLFNWFTIAGIKPNLFIILALFIGLYSGRKMRTSNGSNIWPYNRYFRKQYYWN